MTVGGGSGGSDLPDEVDGARVRALTGLDQMNTASSKHVSEEDTSYPFMVRRARARALASQGVGGLKRLRGLLEGGIPGWLLNTGISRVSLEGGIPGLLLDTGITQLRVLLDTGIKRLRVSIEKGIPGEGGVGLGGGSDRSDEVDGACALSDNRSMAYATGNRLSDNSDR